MENIRVQDRIIKYRNLLNISREELAGEDLSLGLLSLIESGKRKLTLHTASILVKKLNKIGMEKGVLLNIGIKDLIVSEQTKARFLCLTKLDELRTKDFNEEAYLDILKIAKDYHIIDIIYSISENVGEKLYLNNEFEGAIRVLEGALEYKAETDFDILGKIYNRMGASYFKLKDYENAYKSFNSGYRVYIDKNLQDISLKKKLLYNLGLCNFHLERTTEALEFIKEVLTIDDLEEQYELSAKMIQANLFYKLNEYEKALKVYDEIIVRCPEDYKILHNISSTYHKLNRSDDSISYLSKSIQIQLNKLSEDTTSSLIKLGEVYSEKHMNDEAIVCFENAIRNTKVFNQWSDRIDCYKCLYEVHKKLNRIKTFEKYIDNILNEAEHYQSDKTLQYKLLWFLFTYVTECGQLEMGKFILNKLKGGNVT